MTSLTAGQFLSRRQVSLVNKNIMSMESFDQFRQIVLDDMALQERLQATTDRHEFVDLVVLLGEERGCHFTAADVEAAMSANRKAWLQHRMVA
jgi:hypothetical protein